MYYMPSDLKERIREQIIRAMGTLNLPFPMFNSQPAIAIGSDPDPFRTRKSNLSSLLNTDLRERLGNSSAGVLGFGPLA